MLTPLTKPKEIEQAFRQFQRHVTQESLPLTRTLGWHGGNEQLKIYWHSHEHIWNSFKPVDNRYWCSFGTTDPTNTKMLVITCEINPPYKGINRRCAGVFARDQYGNVYIAHSGKIGGGRAGIGRSSFLDSYRGDNFEKLEWPDGIITQHIIIGQIDGKKLLTHIAHFVYEVERFKDDAAKTSIKSPSLVSIKAKFKPEFSGQRKSYRVQHEIESRCDHGLVISALAKELAALDLNYANDRSRDLIALDAKNNVKLLFEAKTDVTTSSIYQAVGQLILHGTKEKVQRRVLVVPEKPKAETQDILSEIGIMVLTYEWDNTTPRFADLKKLLRQASVGQS